MLVNHSGRNERYGPFSYNVFVDEKRTDYEVRFASGKTLKQRTPFENFTYDWNNDGDVYEQFGAFFDLYDQKGEFVQRWGFWTPEDMVFALIEGMDEYKRQREDVVVSITGIQLPSPDKRPGIDAQIRQSEQRAMAQEVERNRKMAALGIRGPGEPWAK